MKNRSHAPIVGVLLILVLLFSGCYVTEDGILVMAPLSPAPQATTEAAEESVELVETPEPIELVGVVNTRSLRVRQGPSVDLPIVAGLRLADEVTVIGRSADNIWLEIIVPDVGTIGWTSAEFIDVEGDLVALAVTTDVVSDVVADEDEVDEDVTDEDATDEDATSPEATPTPVAERATSQIDLVDTAAAIEEFSILVQALEAANLVEILQGEGPFTVFAPTNDAFGELPIALIDALLADPFGDLSEILLYHVVSGEIMAADITDGLEAETVQGEMLSFAVVNGAVQVNGVSITVADVTSRNGVIHVIDTVLVPEAADIEVALEAEAEDVDNATDAEAETPVATEAPVVTTPAPTISTQEALTTTTDTGAVTMAPTSILAEGATRSLRVREAPDAESEVLWGVRLGEFFAVVDQTPDGEWVALAVPKLQGPGWVSTEFITLTQGISVVPTMGTVTVATTDGSRLRVRNEPSVDAELRGFLNQGETYQLVAITEDGEWALINILLTPGPSWVSTEFIVIGPPQP
jgi:uncharacterized surface protein with fasciclin (FAS1) repeats